MELNPFFEPHAIAVSTLQISDFLLTLYNVQKDFLNSQPIINWDSKIGHSLGSFLKLVVPLHRAALP